jgi:hypothetical protein
MGRIVTSVVVRNFLDPAHEIRFDVLVDTGAAYLTLPDAWRERLGMLPAGSAVEMETADQRVVRGEICGPVMIQIAGFRPISSELVFMDMEPKAGTYEPLLGYLPLEQSGAIVDVIGHRLVPVRYVDAKFCA